MKVTGKEPAYPVTNLEVDPKSNFRAGLSMRQYFAAMAMQGLCANSSLEGWIDKDRAREAVYCADALIAELNKTDKEPPAKSWF